MITKEIFIFRICVTFSATLGVRAAGAPVGRATSESSASKCVDESSFQWGRNSCSPPLAVPTAPLAAPTPVGAEKMPAAAAPAAAVAAEAVAAAGIETHGRVARSVVEARQ